MPTKSIMRNAALAAAAALCMAGTALAAGVSRAQEQAALEFLAAAASGNAQAVSHALHPDEVSRLRTAILQRLRDDAAAGDARARVRLFGEASNLGDLERLTGLNFVATVLGRVRYPARRFDRVDGLEAIVDDERKPRVHVLVRGRQPDGRGRTEVVAMVTLLPYGKGWKAALPDEIEAQIEDLLERHEPYPGLSTPLRAAFTANGAGAAGGEDGDAQGGPPGNPPQIREMLGAAEQTLVEGRCDDYYGRYMSPGFRRVTSKNALQTLVSACERSEGLRETLISALRIVSDLPPRYEYGGTRAIYDTTGRGLPFNRFVLERVDERWYIAE